MGIERRPGLCDSTRFFLAIAGLILASACGAPGMVEGVVWEKGFFVRDMQPAARFAKEQLLVVVSEEDGTELRVVSLYVPEELLAQRGEPLSLGPRGSGLPALKVAWGDLVTMDRSDGVRVLSTSDTRYAEATSGTVELVWEDGTLSGTFHATLEDGGYVDGSFVTSLAR